jgi:regulator of replication initiation timing
MQASMLKFKTHGFQRDRRSRRRIFVLVEAVHSEVRVVAEGVSGLSQTVQVVAETVGALTMQVERLDVRFDALEAKIQSESVETRAMIKLSSPSSIAA